MNMILFLSSVFGQRREIAVGILLKMNFLMAET